MSLHASEGHEKKSRAIDLWSLAHFVMGVYLGFFMRVFWAGVVFLIYWELHEVLFYKEVEESVANRFLDLLFGFLGLVAGCALQPFISI